MTSMDEQRKLKQEKIRAEMPVFMHGHGVWEGVYRHLDAEGTLIDQHRSRLLIRFTEEGPHPILQTNLYYWDDGRVEKREFPVDYADRRLIYDNALIKGYFTEIAEDDHGQTMLGYWRRVGTEGIFFYELIVRQTSGFRTRTWQWIKDTGGVFRRTIIDERKVSDDWRSHAHHLNDA